MTDYQPPQAPPAWGPELAAAFAAAQATMPDITKGRKAKVEMKGGGSYSYSYADLSDVLEAVRPILGTHGLFISQDVIRRAGMIDTYTTLGHASGQMVTFGPMSFDAGGTPQTAGSAVTYARRYALLAALGLATEDDDGQAASQAPKPKATARPPAPTPAPIEDDPNAPTAKQLQRLGIAFNAAGMVGRDARLNYCTNLTGRAVASSKELTRAEAGEVIAALELLADELPTSSDQANTGEMFGGDA